jgi:phosphate starvation-inducible PhoH-like protein
MRCAIGRRPVPFLPPARASEHLAFRRLQVGNPVNIPALTPPLNRGYALNNGSQLPFRHTHRILSRLRATSDLPVPVRDLDLRNIETTSMKKSIGISPNIETFFGTRDENVRVLEDGLNVAINLRSNAIELEGAARDVARAEQVFADYESLQRSGHTFNNGDLNSMLKVLATDPNSTLRGLADAGKQRSFGRRTVQPKSSNQRRYLEAIEKHDMVFGVGPAGTGKTYLAVAMAISALLAKRVNRIILARPAVEAGERLGFLPGTLQDKIDPYLRPLYDALYDMLEPEKVDRYLEKNVIEIAPIAFMRGRTLNDSFVILDEAQNTTSEQMKMFVTRLGFNSKAVITGDVTQIDLPNARRSGLLEAIDILKNVNGLAFVHFDEADVVRHHLVQRIVRAYDEHKAKVAEQMVLLSDPARVADVQPSAVPVAAEERTATGSKE